MKMQTAVLTSGVYGIVALNPGELPLLLRDIFRNLLGIKQHILKVLHISAAPLLSLCFNLPFQRAAKCAQRSL